ncbi:restriction endonuclease subunit S [Longimicrobium sp.]|uniref:restriction endonuclease subunit S n=1 Tax=Longimicrobium sp. TaxID=2029185 RepID=UPI003B3B7F40
MQSSLEPAPGTPQICIWNQPAPDGWRIVRMSDVFTRITRKIQTHDLPILTISSKIGFMKQEDRYNRFMAGESLLRYTELHRGEFAYNKGNSKTYPYGCVYPLDEYERAAVPHVYYCFRSHIEIDPVFFTQYFAGGGLNGQLARINNAGVRGNGLLNIGADDFFQMEVPLPPLADQRRIASILGSVDETIRAAKTVVDQSRQAKRGLMQLLLSGGLRKSPLKRTAIGYIPEYWTTARLGDTCDLFNGKASGTGGTRLRVFKTKHVYDGPLLMHQPEYVPDDRAGHIPLRAHLQDGDVLTPNMAHGTIGRVAFVEKAESDWTVDGQVTVIRSRDAQRLLPRFLFDYLSSSVGRKQILEREIGSVFGELRGQTHLYPKDLASILIPVPPVDEQVEIANQLQALDCYSAEEERVMQQSRVLKNGLLQDLLTGRVRVPTI